MIARRDPTGCGPQKLTKTGVNSSVIVMGDPVRQELFQMPLPKRDQEVQALPSDRPHQPLTDGVCLGRSHRRL